MRNRFFFPILLSVFFVGQTAYVNAALVFNVSLTGSQEVPSNGSLATGTGTLILNDAQDRLTMDLSISGVDFTAFGGVDTGANDVTSFHIHRAPAGSNGGVVFGLISPNSDTNGDLVITPFAGGANIFSGWDAAEGNGTTLAAEIANLLNDNLYFNLHSTGFPGGEIRGQIIGVPEPSSLLMLGVFGSSLLRLRRRMS